MDVIFFWRAMAYLAVFHFVRQQYGFLRLYSRQEIPSISTKIDSITIYFTTITPYFIGIFRANRPLIGLWWMILFTLTMPQLFPS